MRLKTGIASLTLIAVVSLAPRASASNGYFADGYGTAEKGLAGAGVALSQDSMAAATNPAGMVFVGNRYDLGLSFFNPNRQYTVTGRPSGFPGTFGLAPGTVKSGSRLFEVPSFGFNRRIGRNDSWGLSLYGNGGMNTDYGTSTFHGASRTGVDLEQLFIAPSFAHKLSEHHSLGVAAIFAYQRFEARGLQALSLFSQDPAHLTNRGHDQATGFGARIGYQGELTPWLSAGIAYQTKIEMGKFRNYAGLFAGSGSFDIPASASAGLAWKLSPAVTLAADVQEIYYSKVKPLGDPLLPNLVQAPLGAADGAGFGWKDMTVYKAGAQWKTAGPWTWRLGYSYGQQPIRSSEVLFNILAPGVVEQHLALGFTRQLSSGAALNFALTRALSHSVSGPNPLEAPGEQQIELKMDQWDVQLGYSWGF